MNNNFVFFHGYGERLWSGFEKRGLLNSFAGVRFCQSIFLPESKKFNSLCARGGKLFNMISENNMPWYIDRLQGGIFIENYPYDMQLINSLGDRFYGFQFHEWISNMRSDYKKLKELPPEDWSEEKIEKEIFRLFPFEHPFLEAANSKEYAEKLPVPQCFEDLILNAEKLCKSRSNYTASRLLACDSVIMAPKIEFEHGAGRVIPEIGAQTPGSNIQIAYARGMAKAYGKSFGAYYEPWGGEPFSVCAYCSGGNNEWNLNNGDTPFDICGGRGGSSRSLQRRLYLYSYLAGAEFISEKWGLYNTFLDTEDYELSPYGKVKKDFLSFVSKYPQGDFFAPVAIVLPKELKVLTNSVCGDWFGELPYSDKALSQKARAVTEGISELMFSSTSKYGNETKTLPNSGIPDAFDIIHEDCAAALMSYSYLVDLTGNPGFAKEHRNSVSPREAKELICSLMPCTVSGGVHWFVSKIEGGWYLTLFNNDGIDRSVENGEQKIARTARTAVIDIKECRSLTRLEGSTDITERDGKYYVALEAGEIFFARLA